MKEKNNKIELLGNVPIPKALLALGLPTMIGMLINALYNLADTYFVGGLGTEQMGAVTVAYPLGQIVVGLGLMFGNGAAAYLSRLLGQGDKETAEQAASTALYGCVSGGAAVIFCVGYGMMVTVFSEGLMSRFTKDDLEMVRIGQMALRANGLSFMTFGFHTVYCFLFLAMGKAKEGCFLGACRQGICFLPAILFLPKVLGLCGVLYAQPMADVLAAAVTVYMAWKLYSSLLDS